MTAHELQLLTDSLYSQPAVSETHISYVLLLEDYAYKIKKTLKLPFLDFSTLKLRKHYCEEELRLNRRLAENTYLEVIPIRKQQDKLLLEADEGKVVDYAVKMRKLDSSLEMDRMLDRKEVTPLHMDSLAERIAAFHAAAAIVQKKQELAGLKAVFNEISREKDFLAQHLKQEEVKIIDRAVRLSNRFLESHIHELEQRSRQGLVRDVHGDLHSKNIFLYKDPVIFDCIEFSDELRQIDLLNEAAFFCMDLEARGAASLSGCFYEKYLAYLSQKGIKDVRDDILFMYFKLYRANVRAKVSSLSARHQQGETLRKELAACSTYLSLMVHYVSALENEKQA